MSSTALGCAPPKKFFLRRPLFIYIKIIQCFYRLSDQVSYKHKQLWKILEKKARVTWNKPKNVYSDSDAAKIFCFYFYFIYLFIFLNNNRILTLVGDEMMNLNYLNSSI